MYRFLLRPKWLAFHLIVAILVVVMVNLGLWQLHRLQDRREFNAEVRERSAVAVVAFESLVHAETDPDDVAWRTVEATGAYLADEQVVVINRSQSGVPGVDVITPIELADGTLVLVNRGFVSEIEPIPPPPSGTVTVVGHLRNSEQRRLGGLTDPEGDLTEIQRLDIDRLAAQLPGPVAPVSIELIESSPAQGAVPAPVPPPELSEGPHLSYMFQWWIFSAAAVAGWVLAVRHSARQVDGPNAPGEPTPADSPSPTFDELPTAPH